MPLRIFTIRLYVALFAVLVACAFATCAHADTVMLGASKDNTLINSPTGSNSNGTGRLYAGRTGGQGPGAQRAVIAFDLASSIPAGAIITDVQLTLSISQAGNGSGNDSYSLHRLQQNWGEGDSLSTGGSGAAAAPGDATWIHTFFDTDMWNTPGGDFESTPSASKMIGIFGSETWGSTAEMVADAQIWLDDPSANFGWILIGDESASASSRQFASRESASDSPVLSVTYTIPEPAALAMGLLGMMSSLGFTRYRAR